ncbi:MAG: DUF3352 domain-containing protein, partial [Nocardioidaceae bacterium]
MSSNSPFDSGDEAGNGPEGGPEFLGTAEPGDTGSGSGGSSKKWPILGVAALAVAGVVGLGGWAAVTLLSGGAQPSEAIPANAIGYVSLDLDPSASQKIEAFKILNKFPGIEKELKVSSQDDLRKWVFEKMQEESTCENLDYGKDIEPWIGDRIALAGVPAEKDSKKPSPLVALQVSDQEAAEKGINALAECGDAGEDFGFAFAEDYVLISDSKKHAESFVAAAAEASLADDAQFQKWTERVGDPGIITMYAAPGAMEAMFDLQSNMVDEFSSVAGSEEQAMLEAQSEMERMNEKMRSLYKDFKGAAAVVRFEDGAVELEAVMDGMPKEFSWAMGGGTSNVTALPAGTGAAFSMGVPEGWVDGYVGLMQDLMGDEMPPMDRMWAELEAETGLTLPEDIETLLGDSVSVAVDEELDFEKATQDPTSILGGLRVTGDPAEITKVVDKIKAAIGPDAEMLVVEEGDGAVALGLNRDYVGTLAEKGSLGDDATFQDAVPDAERATSVLYVDFDAVDRWVQQAIEAEGNIGPDEKKVI